MSRRWQRRHQFLTLDLPTFAAKLRPIASQAQSSLSMLPQV